MHIEGVLVVVRREYLARVRTKSFWISTLALPLLLPGPRRPAEAGAAQESITRS